MTGKCVSIVVAACLALVRPLLSAVDGETCGGKDYPVRAVEMRDVVIREGFWLSRIETNRLVTVRSDFTKCEESGRNDNFRKAARREHGTFKGCPFDDSDVYKVIEGAAYTLMTHPDKKLEAYLDALVADIAGAQEADGYLYTARTLGMDRVQSFPHGKMMGSERWGNTSSSHELYNMGHLIEAAVAFYQATGKRSLLNVAIGVADMLDRTFGYGDGKIRRVPGHEEIELALCRLYRVTGEVRYLKLARSFLEFRGEGRTKAAVFRDAGIQNHLPVLEQDEAIGHAVRAGYLYVGMADVAAFLGDNRYRLAVERLWDDVVGTKLHLTGGIGSYHRKNLPRYGMVCEAFGAHYDLPNQAYLETCAAIANALWNQRMFLLSGDGKYVDVLERILYNGFLSGVSLSGDEFFYPNPLESAGGYKRSKWFGCSCCPVNVVRFMPQIAEFAYATRRNTAYLNLFVASDVRMALDSGNVILEQRTEYPWKGVSAIRVKPSVKKQRFALKVRIPGWAVGRPVPSGLYRQTVPASVRDIRVLVNGIAQKMGLEKGYCTLERRWSEGDVVEVRLPMPIKRIGADARVVADRSRLAVERGPVVFCAEGFDNGGSVLSKVVSATASFSETTCRVSGNEFPALTASAQAVRFVGGKAELGDPCTLKLIPYFAWDHREPGNEMQTWLPCVPEAVCMARSAASVTVSHVNPYDSIAALTDGRIPMNGPFDPGCRRFTFWDHLGTDEWIVFTLPGEKAVNGVDVYWFDDEAVGGRCRVPKSWRVQVQLGEMTGWHDVEADYPVRKGEWSRVRFKRPHPAVQVRLMVRLREGFSAGAYEIYLN